jgi:hypothetical protein
MSKPNEKTNPARASSRPSGPRLHTEGHAHHRSDDGCAFMPDPAEGPARHSANALGNMLAREFLESATAGEEAMEDERGAMEIEELGGPFTASTNGEEFAYGADESNPAETTAEAFPTTRSGRP